MATPAEIQAQLDPANTMNIARIHQSRTVDGTYSEHYVQGGIGFNGVGRWCRTTTANTAAQQATEITNALRA